MTVSLKYYWLIFISIIISKSIHSQEIIFSDDFENYTHNQDLLSLNPTLYTTWNNLATWSAEIANGQGNNVSNSFASSNSVEGLSFIKFQNLELGASYTFSVATKVTNQATDWKRTHKIKAQAGEVIYAAFDLTNPTENTWYETEFSFTVIEGAQNVNFSIYRFSEGSNVHVDDIKLVKHAAPDTALYYIDPINGDDLMMAIQN